MATETIVRISQATAAGTDKKIHNRQSTTVNADGSEDSVQNQVTVAAGPDGNVVDTPEAMIIARMDRMNDLLGDIVELLERLVDCDTRQGIAKAGMSNRQMDPMDMKG